jgi:IS5 family transposase
MPDHGSGVVVCSSDLLSFGNSGRRQTENPLITLCSFASPPLNSIAVTNGRARGGQFILGMHALPGNPFDGHTLTGQIAQVERLTGNEVARAYVDRGYKGHSHKSGADVYIGHTRGMTSPTIKRELRRRNAIEPIIGHTKADGLLERNHLKGVVTYAINDILVAAGHNFRLLIAWFTAFLRAICSLRLLPEHALVR